MLFDYWLNCDSLKCPHSRTPTLCASINKVTWPTAILIMETRNVPAYPRVADFSSLTASEVIHTNQLYSLENQDSPHCLVPMVPASHSSCSFTLFLSTNHIPCIVLPGTVSICEHTMLLISSVQVQLLFVQPFPEPLQEFLP
jgi:hypothetical protein